MCNFNDPSVGAQMDQLRVTVMDDYMKNSTSPDTDVQAAAFGVACSAVQVQTGCTLKVAAMLVRCWISEKAAGG